MSTGTPLKMLGVRLPVDLIRRLHVYAAVGERTATDVVRELLEAALPKVGSGRLAWWPRRSRKRA